MSKQYPKPQKYKLKNPEKYNANANDVVYRSSWEHRYFVYCDTNPNILKWASEAVVIPYVSPVDGRVHRYFMDIWMKYKTKSGTVEEALIEIKPYDQTQPPKAQKRKTKAFENRIKTYAINQAKWKATQSFCQKRNMKFGILTEKGML